MIAAILRAQWLSMRSFRLDSRRRGAIFSLITAAVWYGFWTFLALMAEEFASSVHATEALRRGLPAGLLFVFLYWQFAPIISASLGASLDLKKLLVYPIQHRSLFFIEVLLRITTCAEMLLILAGSIIGLFRNPLYGGFRAAPRLVAPYLVFVLFNLLLSAGLRSLMERMLTHRRLREILMLALVTGAAVPQLLLATRAPVGPWWRRFAESPSALWPWGAVAEIALGVSVIAPAVALICWLAAAWAFGRWQFERSLRHDAQAAASARAGSNERGRGWMDAAYRIPSIFLPDPVAVMVEKELRSLSRTPRFRLVFIMGFSFGLVVWLPIVMGRGARGSSVLADNFLTVVSVYALTLLGQVSYLNAFGFDRASAQVYFSMPVSVGKSLAAKNLAATFFILVEMLAVTTACLVVHLTIAPAKIAEAFVVTAIVGLYLLGIGNLSSVHFPRAMNPERVSQGGAASRLQALIFVFYPLALLPVFLAFWARYVFNSDVMFYLILAFAAILGVVFYWIAMESAVRAATQRREKILMELSRSEGPVATE